MIFSCAADVLVRIHRNRDPTDETLRFSGCPCSVICAESIILARSAAILRNLPGTLQSIQCCFAQISTGRNGVKKRSMTPQYASHDDKTAPCVGADASLISWLWLFSVLFCQSLPPFSCVPCPHDHTASPRSVQKGRWTNMYRPKDR